MIADMAVHGFDPSSVRRWSYRQWLDVCEAFGRAYDTEEQTSKIPYPTAAELMAMPRTI